MGLDEEVLAIQVDEDSISQLRQLDKVIVEDHARFKKIMEECEQLRFKKVSDYGKTYDEYGYVGLLVKLGDKYGRLKRLYQLQQQGKSPNFETSRDSLVDLVNYAAMAIMVLDENNNRKKR